MGIVGLGRIGRSLANKAKGIGLEIIAYDPYLADDIQKVKPTDEYTGLWDKSRKKLHDLGLDFALLNE